jgi:hypothetical protein
MDTITDVKQSRLQKDGGSDVTSYDASVKLSDTGWGALCATVAMLMCEHKARAGPRAQTRPSCGTVIAEGSRRGFKLRSTGTP